MFPGEAYNVEVGITNLGLSESDDTPNCSPAASPNDSSNLSSAGTAEFDDVTAFAGFMRLLAPPARGTIDNTVTQGSNQFVNIGFAIP